jgi:hypothetical protein
MTGYNRKVAVGDVTQDINFPTAFIFYKDRHFQVIINPEP